MDFKLNHVSARVLIITVGTGTQQGGPFWRGGGCLRTHRTPTPGYGPTGDLQLSSRFHYARISSQIF